MTLGSNVGDDLTATVFGDRIMSFLSWMRRLEGAVRVGRDMEYIGELGESAFLLLDILSDTVKTVLFFL